MAFRDKEYDIGMTTFVSTLETLLKTALEEERDDSATLDLLRTKLNADQLHTLRTKIRPGVLSVANKGMTTLIHDIKKILMDVEECKPPRFHPLIVYNNGMPVPLTNPSGGNNLHYLGQAPIRYVGPERGKVAYEDTLGEHIAIVKEHERSQRRPTDKFDMISAGNLIYIPPKRNNGVVLSGLVDLDNSQGYLFKITGRAKLFSRRSKKLVEYILLSSHDLKPSPLFADYRAVRVVSSRYYLPQILEKLETRYSSEKGFSIERKSKGYLMDERDTLLGAERSPLTKSALADWDEHTARLIIKDQKAQRRGEFDLNSLYYVKLNITHEKNPSRSFEFQWTDLHGEYLYERGVNGHFRYEPQRNNRYDQTVELTDLPRTADGMLTMARFVVSPQELTEQLLYYLTQI